MSRPLLFWLVLSCCSLFVWGQSTHLEETHRELYPFCVTSTTPANVTVNDTILNSTRCGSPDEITALECRVLEDTLNSRELVAVVHHNGISFYHVFPISGNTTLIADYFDPCGDQLVVLGFLDENVLIASKGGNASSSNFTCTPLGIGSIAFEDIVSNVTGELTRLTVQPHIDEFSFGNDFFFDEFTRRLWVFGVDGAVNRTLVFAIQGILNFSVVEDFPVNPLNNLDTSNVVLFSEGTGNVTFPTSNGTIPGAISSFIVGPVKGSDKAEVWNITIATLPTLAGSINITKPTEFAAAAGGAVLYISSGLSLVNTTNATFPSSGPFVDDVLLIVDSSSFSNMTVVGNITYAEMIALSGNESLSFNQSHTITSLFTSFNYLWIGWNTGELSVWNITLDPAAPVFITLVFTALPNETSEAKWGVQDICGSLLDNNKAWVTVTEPPLQGDLFNGYILVGPGTGSTAGGSSGGGVPPPVTFSTTFTSATSAPPTTSSPPPSTSSPPPPPPSTSSPPPPESTAPPTTEASSPLFSSSPTTAFSTVEPSTEELSTVEPSTSTTAQPTIFTFTEPTESFYFSEDP